MFQFWCCTELQSPCLTFDTVLCQRGSRWCRLMLSLLHTALCWTCGPNISEPSYSSSHSKLSAPPQTWAGPGGGALPHTTMSADSREFPRCHTQTGKDRTHWGKGLEWTDLALAGPRLHKGAALSSPMVLGLSQRRIYSSDSAYRQTAGRPRESRAQQE